LIVTVPVDKVLEARVKLVRSLWGRPFSAKPPEFSSDTTAGYVGLCSESLERSEVTGARSGDCEAVIRGFFRNEASESPNGFGREEPVSDRADRSEVSASAIVSKSVAIVRTGGRRPGCRPRVSIC
jgi:hypothetical protein